MCVTADHATSIPGLPYENQHPGCVRRAAKTAQVRSGVSVVGRRQPTPITSPESICAACQPAQVAITGCTKSRSRCIAWTAPSQCTVDPTRLFESR